MIFSDETTIEINTSHVRFVRRSPREKIRSAHTTESQTFPMKIMFFGCISIFGTGCLVAVDGNMRSQSYVEIIDNHLLPYAHAWFGDAEWILQQDNAKCHTSALSRRYFTNTGIQLLPWPPCSPDMNPIENMWAILKKKVYQTGSGKTREEVIRKATDIWENDPEIEAAAVNAVISMSRRVKRLLNARGSFTKY